jgi:1,4-alpha-glucan branching enzyme
MAQQSQNNIRFELLAPYNEEVTLHGSWSDYKPIPMQRGDNGRWCVEVPLADGDYEYRFSLISKSWFAAVQRVEVIDPTAPELTSDQQNTAILHIRDGKKVVTTYEWKYDDKPLPQDRELIIYELHVGDFNVKEGQQRGRFVDVLEKLDYLADLGVNALEFMPLNAFPEGHNWGYSQRSLYALEGRYGTPDDLCQLIDECHARGIRVLYDAVYNHMDSESALTRIDYEYWFYKENPDDKDLQFGPKFNYEKYDENLKLHPAREHVINAMRFWIETYHIDGIRFDAARAIRLYDILDWFSEEAKKHAGLKSFYTIAEYIPQNPTVAGFDKPMDAAWHENLSKQLQCTIVGVPKDGNEPFNSGNLLRLLDARQDGFESNYNAIRYFDNHDQDRIIWQLGHYGKTFDDAAFRRVKMGTSILFTAPGVPMLYMGQEMGESSPRTMDVQPLDWFALDAERNKGLHAHYRHLMHVRRDHPALVGENFEALADIDERCIIAYKRWNDEGDVIIVVANIRDEFAGDFTLQHPGIENGKYHEVVHGYDCEVNDNTLSDKLAESDVKIYVKSH